MNLHHGDEDVARLLRVGDDATVPGTRTLRLPYAGVCRECRTRLDRGVTVVYDPSTRTVTCVECPPPDRASQTGTLGLSSTPMLEARAADEQTVQSAAPADTTQLDEPSFVHGTAGASARREHEARHTRRETRIRQDHPRIGGLLLALTDDPQSTRAWSRGAVGEELLARRLDPLASPTLRLLHDRRIRGTQANIDQMVVTPTGVHVIDAKRYQGRPELRVEGGILRPRVERLVVGRRDCTKLVDAVLKQVGLVHSSLAEPHPDVPVSAMLCFVDADWPLIGGAFTTRAVRVLWPKRAAAELQKPGPLDEDRIDQVTRTLAQAFPAA